MGVFWPCPSEDHPGTPRLFEGGRFDASRRTRALPRGRATGRRPRTSTTSIRSSSPPAASSRSSCAATRPAGSARWSSTTRSRRSRSIPASPTRLGIRDGERVRVVSRRGHLELAGARRRDHPARHRLHSVSLARRAVGEPSDRARLRSGRGHPRVQGGGRARSTKLAAAQRGGAVHACELFIDANRCIGCRACVAGLQRVPRARRRSR